MVRVGKGHTRQACTQNGGMVGIGNRDQTNQKASSGTRKVVVMIGKGHTRQGSAQNGGMVGIGNEIQTNQKASSGTRKAMVTIGKPHVDQTKTAKQIRSASEDLGRDW